MKEAFHIDSFDSERGRVSGYRDYTESPDEMRASKKEGIVMYLQITSTSPQETLVNVTFRLKEERHPTTPTRHDEAYLVECYQTFFEFMGAAFPAK